MEPMRGMAAGPGTEGRHSCVFCFGMRTELVSLGEACPGMVSHRDWASRSSLARQAGVKALSWFFCRFGILPGNTGDA